MEHKFAEFAGFVFTFIIENLINKQDLCGFLARLPLGTNIVEYFNLTKIDAIIERDLIDLKYTVSRNKKFPV